MSSSNSCLNTRFPLSDSSFSVISNFYVRENFEMLPGGVCFKPLDESRHTPIPE
jgi:hypothetical protein